MAYYELTNATTVRDISSYVIFDKNLLYNRSYVAEYYKDFRMPEYNPRLVFTLLTLLISYIIFGPIGNIAIIGSVLTNHSLRKPINVLIINLSIADLVEVTVITATSITGLLIGHQVFIQNERLCSFIANICVTSCATSIYTHTAIAISRYIIVKYHAKCIKYLTWKKMITLCCLIWVWGFLMQMPPNLGIGRNTFDLKEMICIWDRTYSLIYNGYFAAWYVIIPVCTVFFFYAKLFIFVWKRGNFQDTYRAPTFKPTKSRMKMFRMERRMRQEFKVAKTLFAHFALVFILWGQYAFLIVGDYKNKLPIQVHATSVQVAHSIAVLNVLIYLANPAFKSGMYSFITNKPMRLVSALATSVSKFQLDSFTVFSQKGADSINESSSPRNVKETVLSTLLPNPQEVSPESLGEKSKEFTSTAVTL